MQTRRVLAPTFSLIALLIAVAGCDAPAELLSGGPPAGTGGSELGGESSTGGGTGDDGFGTETGGKDSGSGGETTVKAVCGNGELEPGEICDDGNTKDKDGCSGDCVDQDPEFDCSTPGEKCVDTVVCGNGVLEGDEGCDDGNKTAGDGCPADCGAPDPGFVCPRPDTPCVAIPECGNGLRERGEQCDDGDDTNADDGCDACVQAEGFFCVPGSACVALVCGDGNRTPDEACDDGPGTLGAPGTPIGGDGCSEACEVEPGFHCGATGCQEVCGDGTMVGDELASGRCDDGNRQGGDGCSAACKVEPFFDCVNEPSECASNVVCGDGQVGAGEICDPPGVDGCLADCKSFSPELADPPVCGNGVIELGETCDHPDVGSGCDLTCQTESGWTCAGPDQCSLNPFCGDGIANFQLGEACDDQNNTPGDGCDACAVEANWTCTGLGPSICFQETCGDGNRTVSEECDDGDDTNPNDGCHQCSVAAGWACPDEGDPCIAKCGDGLRVGIEACDDSNLTTGDGCNAACRVEPSYSCTPTAGPGSTDSCAKGVCGNGGAPESGEGCDDGNSIAGDGCSATCQNEPAITRDGAQSYPTPVVSSACGDGLIIGSEECDDGNTLTGDGCDASCNIENGFTCSTVKDLPSTVKMKVTYRDFKGRSQQYGHPDFEWTAGSSKLNLVGPACTTSNNSKCTNAAGATCTAGTCGHLDTEGKPVFHTTTGTSDANRSYITDSDTYSIWYRDTNDPGVQDASNAPQDPTQIQVITDSLTLKQSGTDPESYSYSSDTDADSSTEEQNGVQSGFFPLTGRGFGNYSNTGKNFHFTSEVRYFFQYQGGETLTFSGDDDVWVFVNGFLAVDLGGMHSVLRGRVILGDDKGYDGSGTDSNCSVHNGGSLPACSLDAAESSPNDTDDTRFGLVKGQLYEIALFHAERHTNASNFNLTLKGFLPSRSYCEPDCGDGYVTNMEVCDDGAANNKPIPESGECNSTCTARAYCGDGVAQVGEACDNGVNNDIYDDGSQGLCAPGCILPPSCGDGNLQAAFEECDNGTGVNTDPAYGAGSCTTACQLGGYCGDGLPGGGEFCDLGAQNGQTYGVGSCSYTCTEGPHCGDNVRNGNEQCDKGSNNGVPGSGCTTACELEPYCGDGVQGGSEDCDYGQFASDEYGSCKADCTWGPSCGDGTPQPDGGEECDLGTDDNTGEYGGCTSTCNLGPRCGDAEVQAGTDEQCDNGYNEDTYRFSDDSCGEGCQAVPYCGDNELQSAFELCDKGSENADDAYDGCTTTCEFGPYCGDGKKTNGELCDNGADNTAYSKTSAACGYDCKPAAYCGDGQRNGPEQCDLGDKNDGSYGGCNEDCTMAPFCGDKKVQKDEGEQCDAGPTGSLSCSVNCTNRGVIK